MLLDQLRKENPQPEDVFEGVSLFNEEGTCAEDDEVPLSEPSVSPQDDVEPILD